MCTHTAHQIIKALLSSPSIIGSSPQILNSAALTVLSPNQAIKSMLIPHSTITWGGEGRREGHDTHTRMLPGLKTEAPGVMRWKHRGRRGRAGARSEKCPCDFDLVRTPDVGQCGDSRTGVNYLLQRYLATAAVAVRTASIFFCSARRAGLHSCADTSRAGTAPPPPTPQRSSLSHVSPEHARVCAAWHWWVMETTGNLRTLWQGGSKPRATFLFMSSPHRRAATSLPVSDDVTPPPRSLQLPSLFYTSTLWMNSFHRYIIHSSQGRVKS